MALQVVGQPSLAAQRRGRRITLRQPRLVNLLAWLLLLTTLASTLGSQVAFTNGQQLQASVQPVPGVVEGDDRFGIGNVYPEAHWHTRARNAGMRWNRWEFRWTNIETQQGQLDLEG